MKKKMILCLPVLAGLIFAGCSDAVTGDTTGKGGSSGSGSTGTITVKLSSASSSRAALDTSAAETECTYYEIIAYNADSWLTGEIKKTADETLSDKSLTVPVGTYNVLVIAGISNTNVILGAGMTKNIAVAEDQTTAVTVTLRTFSVSFTVPSETSCGNTYTVTFTGDTGLDELQISGGDVYVGSSSQAWTGDKARAFSLSATLTAPTTAETDTAEVYYVCLYLEDTAYGQDKRIGSIWGGYLSASSAFYSDFHKSISFTQGSRGIDVTIAWADN